MCLCWKAVEVREVFCFQKGLVKPRPTFVKVTTNQPKIEVTVVNMNRTFPFPSGYTSCELIAYLTLLLI